MIEDDRSGVETNSPESQGLMTAFKFLLAAVLVCAIIATLISFLLPVQRVGTEPARRSQCKNNLKQIALALLNYHDQYHSLPPAYTVDENGKPLHSWRTLILPYLDQKSVYDKIDLTKAWNDPANAEVFKSSNARWVYECPSGTYPSERANHTTYLAVLTPESCFRGTDPRPLSDITDSHSQTLLVLEVDAEHSVPWMSPRDADEALFLAINPNSKTDHVGGTHVLFVDGKVRFLKSDFPTAVRRALISIAGNDDLTDF